jgi:hypothetical protein
MNKILIALIVSLAAVGCASPTNSTPVTTTTVNISPSATSVPLFTEVTFTVTATTTTRAAIDPTAITVSISGAGVNTTTTPNSSGVVSVTPTAVGTLTISATANGTTISTGVNVSDPLAGAWVGRFVNGKITTLMFDGAGKWSYTTIDRNGTQLEDFSNSGTYTVTSLGHLTITGKYGANTYTFTTTGSTAGSTVTLNYINLSPVVIPTGVITPYTKQ